MLDVECGIRGNEEPFTADLDDKRLAGLNGICQAAQLRSKLGP